MYIRISSYRKVIIVEWSSNPRSTRYQKTIVENCGHERILYLRSREYIDFQLHGFDVISKRLNLSQIIISLLRS